MSSITCGKCQKTHQTVAEVRNCYHALPYATTTMVQEFPNLADSPVVVEVEERGENFFLQESEIHRFNQSGDPADIFDAIARAVPKGPVSNSVCYLDVPFEEKDEAKKLGAQWDPKKKQWYINGQDEAKSPKWDRWRQKKQGQVKAAGVTRTMEPRVDVDEGAYRMGDDYYRVVWNQQGTRRYATVIYADELEHILALPKDDRPKVLPWQMARGAMSKLTPEMQMSEEEAAEFGKLTGYCSQCGRYLSNPDSIERGIGPVCAGKMGW